MIGNPTDPESNWIMESDDVDVRPFYFKDDMSAFDGAFGHDVEADDDWRGKYLRLEIASTQAQAEALIVRTQKVKLSARVEKLVKELFGVQADLLTTRGQLQDLHTTMSTDIKERDGRIQLLLGQVEQEQHGNEELKSKLEQLSQSYKQQAVRLDDLVVTNEQLEANVQLLGGSLCGL